MRMTFRPADKGRAGAARPGAYPSVSCNRHAFTKRFARDSLFLYTMAASRRTAALCLALCWTVAHCGAPVIADAGTDRAIPDGAAEDGPRPDASSDATTVEDASVVPDMDAPPIDAAPIDAESPTEDAPDGAPRDARATDGPLPRDAMPGADAAVGPRVDRSMPQLYALTFRPSDADPLARAANGNQPAFLDTRVPSLGRLVVYLHGAGAPATCGSTDHERLLASWGFHVLGPCYVSDYGVSNCGSNIRECRLEAFDGVDRHPFINISVADSIERRVLRALELLQRRNPQGDWRYFIDGGAPRWSAIVISGISHGASSSGVIAQVRPVERAVMLSGPLDTGQAWLTAMGMTAPRALWGFTHTADPQHPGHLAAFASLTLPGSPVTVDGVAAPWGDSHRLRTSAMTSDGHGSTQAGGSSPRDAMGRFRFEPVWRRMYGVP
jgi:hypothetical protein